MDGTIKVSTQELRSASSQFSSYGSEIQNLTSQMLSLISGITGAVADEYDRAEQQAQQEASALKNNII